MGESTDSDAHEAHPSLEQLTAGSTFARYEIVRCIGVGGMGAVFEATHVLLRKRVALKAMHASLGRSEALRARFLREAETVARIRHPNVVDISDVGIERDIPFLVMEYLEGEDLSALLAREGRLEPGRLADLLLPVVAGLCAVHRLGIVHRDLKPENIFFARDALGFVVPKLVDFGVSKSLESSAGAPPLRHTVAGTPYYMAPEQARGSAVLDGRADQYALGVVMYQCLSLQRPFESESLLELVHRIDSGEYVPLRERCPDLPDALYALVQTAMARRIEDRYSTTEAFGQALAAFASEPVKAACARDFAAEGGSRWVRESAIERLNAVTLPSDPVLGARASALREPTAPSSRSAPGVGARDTAPSPVPDAVPALPARSKRAFVSAALAMALVLSALTAWYFAGESSVRPSAAAREAARTPLTPARPSARPASASKPEGAEQRRAEADASTKPEPVPKADEPASPQVTRSAPPKRAASPKPRRAQPVDIQLSR